MLSCAWSRCGPRRVHIGRNWCKSATRATDSQGHDWPAIVVGVTVFFLVIVASIDLLSVVPANVYGYAALVAYSLHQPSAAPATGPLQNLVSPSFANPLVLLIVSMVIGALFGYASDQLAKVLPTKQPTMAAHA